MRYSPLQRVERIREEDQAKEKLQKVIRKAIRNWKKKNNTPVGRKMAAKASKHIKLIL